MICIRSMNLKSQQDLVEAVQLLTHNMFSDFFPVMG